MDSPNSQSGAHSSNLLPWSNLNGVTTANAAEMRSRARRLLGSEKYLAALEKSLIDRTIPAAVETMLHHYAYGKPPEAVELTIKRGEEDLSTLSAAELMERMRTLQKQLEEAEALEATLPAEFKAIA